MSIPDPKDVEKAMALSLSLGKGSCLCNSEAHFCDEFRTLALEVRRLRGELAEAKDQYRLLLTSNLGQQT